MHDTGEIFRIVKQAVTARQAADRYGLKVNRSGLACCPFHHERTPSMKVDRRYYCFGCGATGDAIDLAAQLLGLTVKEAAVRLASDFCLTGHGDKAHPNRGQVNGQPASSQSTRKDGYEWLDKAIRTMTDYLWLLRGWKEKYAPKDMDDEDWHPNFCEALNNMTRVDDVLDELMTATRYDAPYLEDKYGREVERIEKRLERYAGRDAVKDRGSEVLA